VTGIHLSLVMTNTRQLNKTYDVHIFTTVLVKVCEVEASGHAEAMKKAEQQVDFHALFFDERPGYGACETEWAPEITEDYLVDEVGDEEYRQSRWYRREWGSGKIVPNLD
jgi:hypothetical protein